MTDKRELHDVTDEEAIALIDAEIRAVDRRSAEREARLQPRAHIVDWIIASTITLGSALTIAWFLS